MLTSALLVRILAALERIERRLGIMSQALTDKLAELGTKEDQVIALINTDVSTIADLNAANAALKAAQGDDSAQVASVQALIDKLTPVITPAASSGPAPVVDPVAPASATPATGGTAVTTGAVGPGTGDPGPGFGG